MNARPEQFSGFDPKELYQTAVGGVRTVAEIAQLGAVSVAYAADVAYRLTIGGSKHRSVSLADEELFYRQFDDY